MAARIVSRAAMVVSDPSALRRRARDVHPRRAVPLIPVALDHSVVARHELHFLVGARLLAVLVEDVPVAAGEALADLVIALVVVEPVRFVLVQRVSPRRGQEKAQRSSKDGETSKGTKHENLLSLRWDVGKSRLLPPPSR